MPPDRRQGSERPATPVGEAAIRLLLRVRASVCPQVDRLAKLLLTPWHVTGEGPEVLVDQLVCPEISNGGEGLPTVTFIRTLPCVGALVGLEVAA